MDPTPRHRAAERDFRLLLDSGGVAQPDRVDYAPDEVIFRWSEEKLAVVLDMDSPPGTVSFPQRQEATPSPPTGSASGGPSEAMRERAPSSAERSRS